MDTMDRYNYINLILCIIHEPHNSNRLAMPTQEQINKIEELQQQGYKWDKQKSISAAGVVLTKGSDLYFFGLQGEIMHNPTGYSIKL